jgi:Flp pilus assembly protein CpaB
VVPTGHRAVTVRFASPDAVDLVAAGDHIDVVGTDGSVLEANIEVLQDRSTELATVLVLAVTEERAPELAAAAVTQDLTLLVTPEP